MTSFFIIDIKHEPNQTTIEAIEEGKQMLDDPNTPSYSTTEELITALDK